MIDGDAWQHGEPPTTEELKKHAQAGTSLLLALAWCRGPIEAKVGKVSPNGEYFTIEMIHRSPFVGRGGADWFARTDARIVDILSTAKRYHNSPGHDAPASIFESEDEV